MSAEVDSVAQNGDVERGDSPQAVLNGSNASDDDGDLFGDDDEELDQDQNDSHRRLDDSELDSGDDEGRTDRVAATVEDHEEMYEEQKQLKLLDVDMARIKPPEGEELYLLNMPPFLGIKHRNFSPATYEPPKQPHDGRDPEVDPTAKFSAFSTAASTIFWRRDPKNPELLQSNSRIVRWSDGSLTLQIASSPKDHYRISTTALRQDWPKNPGSSQAQYDANKDSHNYLAAPHATAGVDLQIVAPFDASMKIQPTGDLADESVLMLQQSLAAATQMHDPLASLKQVKEDPELAKKAAEMFEKERSRASRKREAAEDRLLMRKDRVLGRAGLGRMGGAGLSVAGLEDDDGMPLARGKKSSNARNRRVNRRGDIYSDDEDENMPRGRGREDEYDREDDFLAASDEEPEIYEDAEGEEAEAEEDDDPDVDDLEIEGRETVIDNRTRGGNDREGREKDRGRNRDRESTPKRAASADNNDEGEAESAPAGTPQARKKRRVIDDDEDEE